GKIAKTHSSSKIRFGLYHLSHMWEITPWIEAASAKGQRLFVINVLTANRNPLSTIAGPFGALELPINPPAKKAAAKARIRPPPRTSQRYDWPRLAIRSRDPIGTLDPLLADGESSAMDANAAHRAVRLK